MPVFASRFRSAASPDFSVTLRCDSQARECRLVHASVGQPELERVEQVERVASLATAFARSDLPRRAARSEHRQLKLPAVTQWFRGTSCSLTLNAPQRCDARSPASPPVRFHLARAGSRTWPAAIENPMTYQSLSRSL